MYVHSAIGSLIIKAEFVQGGKTLPVADWHFAITGERLGTLEEQGSRRRRYKAASFMPGIHHVMGKGDIIGTTFYPTSL